MASSIVEQLRHSGKVTRGYLGVRFQPLTADLAKSFGLESEKGALISVVEKDTPADKAGLKVGDVILEYDGKTINELNELPKFVAATPVDKKVRLVLFRDGSRQDIYVVVGKLTDVDPETASSDKKESNSVGLVVEELTKHLADRYRISDSKGLIITKVKPGSAAEESGITAGSILIELNGRKMDSLKTYNALLAKLKKKDVVRLLLRRPDGSVNYVALKLD